MNILFYFYSLRKSMGYCPQEDILFPLLTVKEHLQLFAQLRNVKQNGMYSMIPFLFFLCSNWILLRT